MRKPWETVKTKILLGYLLIIGISAFTVWLIYSEFYVHAENRTKINALNNKIIYFNSVLTNLYQAETLERTYSQTGNPGHYANYENLMNIIIGQFDSLSMLSADPHEKMHADSIVILLKEKRQNLKELVWSRNLNNSGDLVERAINEFSYNRDSINTMLNTRKIIMEKSESTYVEQKKRKFLERLAYAFSPKTKTDSVLQINNQQVVQTDTVLKDFNPADSVIQMLSEVMMDIRKENELNEQQLARKENLFLANDRIITLQLRQMLTIFEKDIIVGSLGELGSLQERIRDTTWYLIALGSLALAIIIIFLLLILKDITQSQRYRLELEKAKAYSDSLLKSKEQFMLSITHDIKSPIASITGYARLMNETSEQAKKESYFDAIIKSTEHIMKLINDLFDFTRLETGKLNIENLPFNLESLINDVNAVFLPIAAAKNLLFDVQFEVSTDKDYISDPSRIKQILSNLISNAIKYTDSGWVTLKVTVEKTVEEKDLVQFSVTDTGIGISEEDSKIIFNEFSQIQFKDRERYEGVGLGLSIAQRLVYLLQGSISVFSKPGEGSSFTVQLPLERSVLAYENISDVKSPVESKKRILVLDDDEIFLNLIAETLHRTEMQVFKCNSPSMAIQTMAKQAIDLIITDIQIPTMSGIDFLAYIQRKSGRYIPVIAITGRDSAKPEDYPGIVISSCLIKPFLPEELFESIEKVFKPVSPIKLTGAEKKNGIPASESEKIRYNLHPIRQFAINDPESIQRILTSFAESSYENLNHFQRYMADNDRNSLAELSHKMLAMFRQLEAEDIVKLLMLIERNMVEQMSDKDWNDLLNHAYRKISRFIDTFCEEQGISVLLR